ncbi:insulinase family protein [Marinilactibacillus kalidii]|uniref:insulinase family protein n=1 Tax=Marinilactibacillus kalidii TaxID=2820274 RepID=UPI001ABE2236|nr:insulinase family protein [Marinilactibacillus kalidii]
MSFQSLETKELTDIQSVGTLYEHEETGAKVLYLKNDDPNKSFTIGFKTPPYNDNGIAHILEHSVLNGSEKYPSKEPFVELIKGSLNTFVNAMTFSDKTIYPVASTNQKDFKHLMGVYLDAVFKPNLYTDEQILEQEGWHYHLEDAEDELIYKGVVYNEMKGATASPERQVYQSLISHLYPESIYSYESGGEPQAIPSLTHKEFVEFHENYYHPSNSLTILYGDLDIDEAFASLEAYFDGMGKKEPVDLSIEVSEPAQKVYEGTYSITEGDTPEGKDFLALGWHVASQDNPLDKYGLEVLQEILFGSNQAPLKKALLDAEIGGDIDGDVDDIGFPTAFTILSKYADASKMDKLKQVVEETLSTLAKDGINKELIEGALNKITFQTKEAAISEDNPRGVIYAIRSLSTWLYEKDPFVYLSFSTYLDQLREQADNGYFEKLITDKILNNPIRVEVTLTAEPGKNDKLEAETLEKLQAYKAEMSEEDIEAIVTKTKALIKRQETPDSPEDLAKIPTLTREDLNTEVENYPLEASTIFENTRFYHADQFTSGIDYINLYFDMSDFKQEDYPLLGYLSKLLSRLGTKNYDVATLQRQSDLHTGGIYATMDIFENLEGELKPQFVIRGKGLADFSEKVIELMHEIMAHTAFTDKAEMLKITQRSISNFENAINYRAHVLAANRALSQIKPSSKLNELAGGIDQFGHLKSIRDDLKAGEVNELAEQLQVLLAKILNKKRMTVLYVGESERVAPIKAQLETAFSAISDNDMGEKTVFEAGSLIKEAYVTAQDVNYVSTAADATGIIPFTGSTSVLGTVFRFDYLWNEIRVKGGAYGSLYNHRRNGNFALGSYRDPNISKTLNIYQQLPSFIEKLTLSESELVKYIIGTMSPLEQPNSAFSKGLIAYERMNRGLKQADIKQLKEEILSTTSNDLVALADDYRKVLEKSTVVVIGNKAQIEKEKALFDKVIELY